MRSMIHILKLHKLKWCIMLMMKYKDWKIVVHLKPQDLYDMGEGNEVCEPEPCHNKT